MTSTLARDRHCKDSRILGAYLDGELDPSALIDVETHLSACETCRERAEVDRATRQSLKRVVRGPDTQQRREALASLRSRSMTAMLAERARSDARALESEERGRLLNWRTMVPVASAAALALFWGAASRSPVSDSPTSAGLRASVVGDDLVSELLSEHTSDLPPQWTDRTAVRGLDKYVGVPVRPAFFERGGASLVGASVFPLGGPHRVAHLVFDIDGVHRASVYVYNPSDIQIEANGFSQRNVGSAQVQYGKKNGFSVAMTQAGGVGYVLTSDLDPDKSVQLAAQAVEGP
jgi:anti-sigma factor RsiW